jgi:cytochrome c biogenesis factor
LLHQTLNITKMEIKITTKQILKVLNIIAWIIFIGLCINAGGYIANTLYSLFYNSAGASKFWENIDFSSLYDFDKGQFFVETFLMIIVAVFKALMFYLIIKNLDSKKINISKPFKKELVLFIQNLSYLAMGIGLFSFWGSGYTKWLVQKGVKMPDINQLDLAGGDIWIFMGITLLVIAQILKRGLEIQEENDLIL